MGMEISWSALLAPAVAKIVQAIVEAVLKAIAGLIRTGQDAKALASLASLMSFVENIEGAENKTAASFELARWAQEQFA